MKAKVTTAQVSAWVVAAMVLLPRGAQAQLSIYGSEGGSSLGCDPPDGDPPVFDLDNLVYCPEDGSNAHYDEFLE